MDLINAEVQVTTRHLINSKGAETHLLRLANYGEMSEFYTACAERFPKENNPVYHYPSWENIPSNLINRDWICPNIFEIRDAIEQLDESEYDHFVKWCRRHGHNIAVDDPHLLVSHFRDMHGTYTEQNDEPPDFSDEDLLNQCLNRGYFDTSRYATEIFDDNYD